MQELAMLLLYLSRFREHDSHELDLDRAWKGYDFGLLNDLEKKDYIRQGSFRSKSLCITAKGKSFAQDLLSKYGLEDDC